MNLIARSLLTEDEILRIERPYALVMLAGQYPAVMRLPDLSEWRFNLALGMGDQEHNRKLREIRERGRTSREPTPIKLWGVWDQYRKKKRTSTDFGEHGGMELTPEDVAADGKTLRLPPRVYPGAVNMREVARAGRETDDMFSQFSKDHHLRGKEKDSKWRLQHL